MKLFASPRLLATIPLLCLPVHATGQDESATMGCDATALYVLLELEREPRELAAIGSFLSAKAEEATPMSRLQAVAGQLGLATRPIAVRSEKDWVDRPMLILLRRGEHLHHIVARPVGHSGKLVQVFDSLHEPRILDKSALLASPEWTGAALVAERPWNRWRVAGTVVFAAGCGFLMLAGIGAWKKPGRRGR